MLYSFGGLEGEQLPQEKIDEIKSRISAISDEKKVLLQQHKILKSQKAPVSYLSAESDRLAFGKKIASLEKVQNKIVELRKARNSASTRKSKWEHTINELRSLNRTISCGELRCMDCNSTNISFSTGETTQTSYHQSCAIRFCSVTVFAVLFAVVALLMAFDSLRWTISSLYQKAELLSPIICGRCAGTVIRERKTAM